MGMSGNMDTFKCRTCEGQIRYTASRFLEPPPSLPVFCAFGFRKGVEPSGTSFMGETKVVFVAICLPCPQSMFFKPTQFPPWECSVFRFITLLPFGEEVFPQKIL